MRIKVKQPVLDYEGQPLMTAKTGPNGAAVLDEHRRAVTEPELLLTYLSTALNSVTPGEVLTPEDKAKIYMLTTKLYKGVEVDLTDNDRVFIRERVGKVYGPLIYGRVCEALRSVDLPDEMETAESKQAAKK